MELSSIDNIIYKLKNIKYHFLPIDIDFNKLAFLYHNDKYFSFLKSPINNKDSNLTILGLIPDLSISLDYNNKLTINQDQNEYSIDNNIFQLLDDLIHDLEIKDKTYSFTSALTGYFSYNCSNFIEKLPYKNNDPISIHNAVWVLHSLYYIYDHKKSIGFFSYSDKIQNSFQGILKNIQNKLSQIKIPKIRINNSKWKSNITKKQYLDKINTIKKYITNGDIYQINFTYSLEAEYNNNPFLLFQAISQKHPTPYAAYLNYSDFQVLSFSPERLLSFNKGKLLAQPMKGTRPRGKNNLEDDKLKSELVTSEKDRAELLMICDLIRNDLGKVSEYNSVKVNELFHLEEYKSVFQMTSEIESLLKQGNSIIDAVKSLFPCGSITGCPKIRSMQLIDELELDNRSLFMGSLGYISFNQTADLNVCIRTLIHKDNKLYFRVGGGIVYDSIAEEEYIETQNKSAFLKDYFNFDWI